MSTRRFSLTRRQMLLRVQGRLQDDGFPRLQMSLLVVLTGGFGLLSSFGLLQAGLASMALRYPSALALAYVFFLLLLWMWLRWRGDDVRHLADMAGQTLSSPNNCGSHTARTPFESGEGGEFAGGGASGSFDTGTAGWRPDSSDLSGIDNPPTQAISDAASAVGEADELAIPLAVVLLTAGLALAMLYVVYIAPALMAELLVDGALSYVLFRRLRHEEQRHWLSSAVRHTWLPFLLTGLFLCAAGAGLAWFAPGAESVGDVISHATSHRS
jgi:hypothetical protein